MAPAPGHDPARVSLNPADRPAFRRTLLRFVDHLASTVSSRGDDADQQHRQDIAAAWVYVSAVAVWVEDHGLVPPLIRSGPPGLVRNRASGALWLGRAFQQLAVHPATQWLLHPAYNPMLWAGTPSPSACTALIDWWASEAPTLSYPSVSGYPASITGWPIGDLLQHLSPHRRSRHALVQTPHFVADLILDRTLIPAAAKFSDEVPLRLVDPTCGTGHFLIRAVDYLWPWYTTGTMRPRAVPSQPAATGGTIRPPEKAARLILAGVDGVDIDPLTTAVARLRLTVSIGHLMAATQVVPAPLRLATIPAAVAPRIAVGTRCCWAPASPAPGTPRCTRSWPTCPAPLSRSPASPGRPNRRPPPPVVASVAKPGTASHPPAHAPRPAAPATRRRATAARRRPHAVRGNTMLRRPLWTLTNPLSCAVPPALGVCRTVPDRVRTSSTRSPTRSHRTTSSRGPRCGGYAS